MTLVLGRKLFMKIFKKLFDQSLWKSILFYFDSKSMDRIKNKQNQSRIGTFNVFHTYFCKDNVM